MSDRDANLAWWEDRAGRHADTAMYRPWIEQLRRGEPALFPLERRLAGDVDGLRLLHVPCHIGHDTLSWALLGAQVTGVDFSPTALAEAERLTDELGLRATWVEADATALPSHLDGRFDRVVATYGTYGWFEDLQAWIDGIARALVPGGSFVFVDGHPLFLGLGLDDATGRYTIEEPVMGGDRVEVQRAGTYAEEGLETEHDAQVGWCHGIGELVTALLRAGLVIEHLEEHDWSVWPGVPGMVERDGAYVLPEPWHGRIPLLLSIVARKPVQ